MKRTRILIADDHKMFAQGLQGLLEDEFDLVGTVADGKALVDAAQLLQPDVVVVDISMPVLNGLDAVRRLKELGISAKVIFLTMHADDRLLAEAFRCGGVGYVLKQSAGEDLIHAIKQALAGHKYVTPLIASEWVQDLAKQVDHTQKLTLTPRQREVLLCQLGRRVGAARRRPHVLGIRLVSLAIDDEVVELVVEQHAGSFGDHADAVAEIQRVGV